jgi:hypothetical protein
MRKITFLLAVMAVFSHSNKANAVSINASTAWWNAETFESYTAPTNFTTGAATVWSGWTGSFLVGSQTITAQTTGSAIGNVLGFTITSPLPTAFTQATLSGSRAGTKNNFTVLTGGYIYGKTSFFNQTGGNGTGCTYSLKNSTGGIVFEFGGMGATSKDLWCTGVTAATMNLGVRSNWADIEFVLDLANNLAKKVIVTYSGTTRTYTDIALVAGGNLNTLLVTETKGTGSAGLDNTTLGQLVADNIKNITSSQTTHQTLDATTVNTTLGVTSFTTAMSQDFAIPKTDLNVTWTVTNWGGLSTNDQTKISLARGSTDYTAATLTTTSAISVPSADLIISATYGATTLNKTITVKGLDISALKASLNTEITNANALMTAVTDINPYITSAKSTLSGVVTTSQGVYDNASAVVSDVITAISNLQAAEASFNSAMAPYNTFVTSIVTATSTRDAEVRNTPAFFSTIKGTLTTAISIATTERFTISNSGDIASAQSALQSAVSQFTTDKPTYDNLNTLISTLTSRLSVINVRKGDTQFLMFPTATVQTLTDANTAAQTTRDNATTATDMSTAQTTLTSALNTFNAAARVSAATSYYRIYTHGVDNGDGSATKSILYAEGTTLKYKVATSTLDPNSIWQITEVATNTYTIKNIGTGNYLNGTSLSGSATNFTLPEGFSQSNYSVYGSETYFIYNIVNPSSKGLEVDVWSTTNLNGTFLISSSPASRYRFCYTFEPVATIGGSGNLSSSTNWSLGSTPANGSDIIVSGGTLTVDQNATLANIEVLSGATLSVNAGKQLTATTQIINNGTINLNSDANGTATFIDQTGTSVVAATVQQFVTGTSDTNIPRGWWYVSSPVSNAKADVFIPDGSNCKFGYWDEASCTYPQITDNTNLLNKGQGYVFYNPGNDAAISFTGTLNTGDITVYPTRTGTSNLARGFNLVGNPYPSFLDWNAATKTNVRNTIWYRTWATGGGMTFDTYDGTTGTANGVNGQVSNFIPPMQGFWVKVNADGDNASVVFHNADRSHKDQSTATNRLRVKAQTNDAPGIVRLRVSNGVNADETILVADPNALDAADSYDSPKMKNNNSEIPEIFTVAGTEEMVINHLNNFSVGKELTLGFRPGKVSDFSIAANAISNVSSDLKVVLVDNLTKATYDLTDGSAYTFSTTDAAATSSRFSVQFKSVGVVNGIGGNANDKIVVYQNAQHQIAINLNNQQVDGTISVFNAVGQKLTDQSVTSQLVTVKQKLCTGNICGGTNRKQPTCC